MAAPVSCFRIGETGSKQFRICPITSEETMFSRGSTGTEGVGRYMRHCKRSLPQQIFSYEGTSFEDIRLKRKQKNQTSSHGD
ncbi:hypothetical protein TNCV_1709091 [Trichonephila clavipes]|nr:hypothetical protein TNCV_1709091 [Trichonephila clavipes]